MEQEKTNKRKTSIVNQTTTKKNRQIEIRTKESSEMIIEKEKKQSKNKNKK
jgi:hypothetical protein